MDSKTIYLDYSATTPIHSKVWEEMGAVYGQFGNASSIHQIGQKSNYLLSQASIKESIYHVKQNSFFGGKLL